MDIRTAGVVAVIVVDLGTAFLTSTIAVSSISARGTAWASVGRLGAVAIASPALQVLAGAVIIWLSLLLLGVGDPAPVSPDT